MKIPSGILWALAIICGLGMIWVFQSRPMKEWPILLVIILAGAWLGPTPKK